MGNTTISQIAGCYNCGWSCHEQFEARKQAASHSKKMGHSTWAEVTRLYNYKGSHHVSTEQE